VLQDIAIVPFLVLLPLIESNGGMEGASADTLLQVRLFADAAGWLSGWDLIVQHGAAGQQQRWIALVKCLAVLGTGFLRCSQTGTCQQAALQVT
jgi:hypothetical protein